MHAPLDIGYRYILDAAAPALLDQGFVGLVMTGCKSGSQADVLFVTARRVNGHTERFAIKAFRRNTLDVVKSEYEVLHALSDALLAAADSRIRCPLPVAIVESALLYIMTYVEGDLLEDYVRRTPGSASGLAPLLVDALQAVHSTLGTPYGDFSSRNILVGPGNRYVCLLDPTYARGIDHEALILACAPASVDVGYWLHDAVTRELRQALKAPRYAAEWFRLTDGLLRGSLEAFAPSMQEEFLDDVERVVASYADTYRRATLTSATWLALKAALLRLHLLRARRPGATNRQEIFETLSRPALP
jgi:tRNA A-37 threonylcarbamoyl transferase component Bud32